MTLLEFARNLRPHDASVAIALLELVRRADPSGALDRGAWLAAVQAAYRKDGATSTNSTQDELASYLEQNILARLHSEGIASGEPEGEAWERVRLRPAVLEELGQNQALLLDMLEHAAGALLAEGGRRGAEIEEMMRHPAAVVRPLVVPPLVVGGSTLSARGLVKAYRRRKVVNEVDVSVSQGEIVGLLGPNGAGKTTTFYMIVGLISPDEGQVFIDEEELTGVPMYKRARKGIGYLSQEPSVFRKLTVEQNIMAILETMPLSRKERKERLEMLLDELGIKHLRRSQAYSLSGGERRRLEITRALVSQPKFMLLDEPFAGVDPIAVHDIQQIVAELRERRIGVIITDHNVEQTLDIVDRAYIMYDGRVRVSGTVGELVWNEEVAEIYFGPTLTARMRERYSRPEVAVG
jgi:lipopolysaccharide export system ATP-binding protein